MATQTRVTKWNGYGSEETGRSITYSTQRVGIGEDEGLASIPNTRAINPGNLHDSDDPLAIDGKLYIRTDLTETSGIPEEIVGIANVCWTEAIYTAHEAHLRQ